MSDKLLALADELIGCNSLHGKPRTHFKHTIDQLDSTGEITETIAAADDCELAEVLWRAAIERWPDATIILRQGARVVHDSRRPRAVK
jgi:hypothetical protein